MTTDTTTEERYGNVSEKGTLTIQRVLPGPIERVWSYLTDSDLRRKWLAAGDLPSSGQGTFELVWRNDELSEDGDLRPEGFDAEQRMTTRLISMAPMQHLTFTWGAGEVTFAVETRGENVLLTIKHTGLDDRGSRTNIGSGWHMHLDILAALTEGRAPGSFWAGWGKLKTAYEARMV